jgi:hypothetical protein
MMLEINHHIMVNLFVRKPELNGANLPNFDLNSCHFCPSFFCQNKVKIKLTFTNTVDSYLVRYNAKSNRITKPRN